MYYLSNKKGHNSKNENITLMNGIKKVFCKGVRDTPTFVYLYCVKQHWAQNSTTFVDSVLMIIVISSCWGTTKGYNNTLPSVLEGFGEVQPYKTCRYEGEPMHRIIVSPVSIKMLLFIYRKKW